MIIDRQEHNTIWHTSDFDDVYPGGGVLGSPRGVFQPTLERAGELASELIALRGYLATSGAMRWPWSQEAPLRVQMRVCL